MKPWVVALVSVLGCGARQDTALTARVQQLESELVALKSAPIPEPPPPRPAPRDRKRDRAQELADRAPRPDRTKQLADLQDRVEELEQANRAAWNEIERLMFGDVRALDAKPMRQPGQRRPELRPDIVYAVPIKGNPTDATDDAAKVTWVIGFEAVEPYTRRLLPTAKALRAQYGKDLRIVYKHFIVHDDAVAAAMMLCAADRQGMFDKALDAIAQLPLDKRGPLRIGALRGKLGFLDKDQLDADLTGSCKKTVRDDHVFAHGFGLSGTPYSFVNGRPLGGAQPEEAFKRIIDEELAKANAELGTKSSKGYYDKVLKRGQKTP